jgi:hypothetical protein
VDLWQRFEEDLHESLCRLREDLSYNRLRLEDKNDLIFRLAEERIMTSFEKAVKEAIDSGYKSGELGLNPHRGR